MPAAKPKQSLDLAAIFDGHIEKESEQNKEGGMTDRKTIDSHLAETVEEYADTQALAATHDLSTHQCECLGHCSAQSARATGNESTDALKVGRDEFGHVCHAIQWSSRDEVDRSH